MAKNEYPSGIQFQREESKLTVSYKNGRISDGSLDVWGLAHYLNKIGTPHDGSIIDLRLPQTAPRIMMNTLCLRHMFLRGCFGDIRFLINGTEDYLTQASSILDQARNGQIITYGSQDLPAIDSRGTKETPESQVEEYFFQRHAQFLDGEFPVLPKRQFPANMYFADGPDGPGIRESNRATSRYWIDMLSANRAAQLSPIEIKVGNNMPLDVFIQGVDYAVYCSVFRESLTAHWFQTVNSVKVALYLVMEKAHPFLHEGGERKSLTSVLRGNQFLDFVGIRINTKNFRGLGLQPSILFDTRRIP